MLSCSSLQPLNETAANKSGMIHFILNVLTDKFSICRLPSSAKLPGWLPEIPAGFCSVTRTKDELSIVCQTCHLPAEIRAEHGWRCLQIAGPLDFELVGVMARLTTALAAADVSVFVVSTFETDYLLVKAEQLPAAVTALKQAGHSVRQCDTRDHTDAYG